MFIQQVKMTDEEKFDMYMKVPHEELVRMKIEEERILEMMDNDRCCDKTCKKRTIFQTVDNSKHIEPVYNVGDKVIYQDDVYPIEYVINMGTYYLYSIHAKYYEHLVSFHEYELKPYKEREK